MKALKGKTLIINIVLILMLMIMVTVTGCRKRPVPVQPACNLPSGYIVDQAFDTAYDTLSKQGCRYRFDEVMEALLEVCEGAPQMKNKELFSNLLVWAKDQGIISTVQAKNYYNTYFSSIFISLPDDYQTCSYADKYEKVIADCKAELEKKEQGLVKVCSDSETFAKATNDLNQFDLIFLAACKACNEE